MTRFRGARLRLKRLNRTAAFLLPLLLHLLVAAHATSTTPGAIIATLAAAGGMLQPRQHDTEPQDAPVVCAIGDGRRGEGGGGSITTSSCCGGDSEDGAAAEASSSSSRSATTGGRLVAMVVGPRCTATEEARLHRSADWDCVEPVVLNLVQHPSPTHAGTFHPVPPRSLPHSVAGAVFRTKLLNPASESDGAHNPVSSAKALADVGNPAGAMAGDMANTHGTSASASIPSTLDSSLGSLLEAFLASPHAASGKGLAAALIVFRNRTSDTHDVTYLLYNKTPEDSSADVSDRISAHNYTSSGSGTAGGESSSMGNGGTREMNHGAVDVYAVKASIVPSSLGKVQQQRQLQRRRLLIMPRPALQGLPARAAIASARAACNLVMPMAPGCGPGSPVFPSCRYTCIGGM